MTAAAHVKVFEMRTGATSVEQATRDELLVAGRVASALGLATLSLARRVDNSDDETGASLAALHRQFAASLTLALSGAEVEEDELEKLRRRRDGKRDIG